MALIPEAKLDKFIAAGVNVLFEGPHGVGKTAMMKAAFERAGLKAMYFSASTLDPWVDLIGAPKPIAVRGTKTKKAHDILGLVRPQWVMDDDVDVIFFDELNRAPDKVLNAVMELIQFKSLNGHQLQKLKMVWGAINPSGEEDGYMVTELDPAQRDRFQVQIKVPFDVDEDYFKTIHGSQLGKALVSWWNDLAADDKLLVSPRRLDYVGEAFTKGLGLADILPYAVNPSALEKELKAIPFLKQLVVADSKGEPAVKAFLSKANNAFKLAEFGVNSKNAEVFELYEKWKHLISAEIIEGIASKLKADAEAEAASRKARKIMPNIIKVLTSYSQTKLKELTPLEVINMINNINIRADYPVAQHDTLWMELRDTLTQYRSTNHEPIISITARKLLDGAVHQVGKPEMFMLNGAPTTLTHMIRAYKRAYPDVYVQSKLDYIAKKMDPAIAAAVFGV